MLIFIPHRMANRLRLYLWISLLCFALPLSAAQPPLRLLTSEKMPFNYLEAQQIRGISIDMLQLLFDGVLPSQVELMPWPRAYETALQQKNVLLFTMGKTAGREALGFTFIGPVSRRYHSVYAVRQDLPPIHSLADIKKHRLVVAGLRAGWLSEQLKAAGIRIETVGSYRQGMEMLQKDRAQLWLSTDLEEQVLQSQQSEAPALRPVWQLMCSQNYFALSPGSDPKLAQRLAQKYQQLLQSGAARAVAQKWQRKLGLPLQLDKTAGFYLQPDDILRCTPSAHAG